MNAQEKALNEERKLKFNMAQYDLGYSDAIAGKALKNRTGSEFYLAGYNEGKNQDQSTHKFNSQNS